MARYLIPMGLVNVCIGPLLCVFWVFLPCFRCVFPSLLPLFLTMYRIASFLSQYATVRPLFTCLIACEWFYLSTCKNVLDRLSERFFDILRIPFRILFSFKVWLRVLLIADMFRQNIAYRYADFAIFVILRAN